MSTADSNNKFEGPSPLFQPYLAPVPCSTPAPIGVFWDIENCSIPFHKSALGFVQKIRDRFFAGRKEAEFMCACDTGNQNKDTIQELNDAQVTVVHISAVSKNTADDKIRQSLRRFAADHKPPADVILISGDVNFASDLSDLRYRHHIHIILVHRKQVAIALTSCAHESYCFEDFIEDLPTRTLPKSPTVTRELVVTNLPVVACVQNSLQRLCKSVRGRIIQIDGTTALLRFPSNEATLRAQKRLNGESVMGQKIKVSFPSCSKKHNQSSMKFLHAQESFQVAYSTSKFRESATPEAVQATSGGCNLQVDLSFKQSAADRMATEDKHETNKYKTDGESEEIIQNSGTYWPSAEVLAGDIVIEGEEEEVEEEEECGRNGGNVSFRVSSPLADIRVDAGDDGVSGVLDVDIRPTKLQTEVLVVQNEEKPKRKKKQKCKTSSVEKSHKTFPDTEKLEIAVMEKQKHPKSISSVDITNQQANTTNHSMTLYSSIRSVADNKTINAGHSFSNWPSRTLLKTTGQGIENTPGRRTNTYDQSYLYVKDDASFLLHDWQCANNVEQHQPKALSFQPSDLEQIYGSCSRTYDGHQCNSILPNIGEKEKNFSEVRTSTPWKSSSPDKFSFENINAPSGFRRTPGARRPRDNRGFNGSSTNPKCLVSSAAEAKLIGSSYFAAPGSRDADQLLSAKEFHRSSDETGLLPVGIDVIVSNLDYNISMNEWKKILADEFRQHVQVISVRMQLLQDNTSVGYVRVRCTEDARCAISHFHRKKIGYKRIHVALVNSESPLAVANVKAEVVDLLKEVSGNRLPLFKFIELFDKRFQRRISVSELYHMKDTVDIIEQDGAGRMVVLMPALKDNAASTSLTEENAPTHLCRIHRCWGTSNIDSIDMYNLPHVILQLCTFSAQVHKLLQSHDGSLPLVSFPSCFSVEFGELKTVMDGGIPLEHLITCVPGVQISLSECGIKSVHWAENRSAPSYSDLQQRQSCSSPGIGQQMSQFVHEVIDLLKNFPQCRVPFSKFIPAYHHHFGRQLRVADYGYTKLTELFEAIPHVAQIIGNGCQKYVTLTHKAQLKRFTVDLLRILKLQSGKQISAVDLPVVYNKVVGRTFNITDYGVCFLEDLIGELPESSFTTIGIGLDAVIALPKREQTSEEMEKTKQFAREAIDLLRLSPQFRMSFSKFIPAYHRHFGKQCRVADYGFAKLMELFEALPDIITILDQHDEKDLCLTEQELVHVIGDQMASLLHSYPGDRIAVSDFHSAYLKAFGHSLQLGDFGVKSVVDLVKKIPSVAQVMAVEDGLSYVCPVDCTQIQLLAHNVLLILMDLTEGSILLKPLVEYYQRNFGCSLDVDSLTSDLQGIVEVTVSEETRLVKLTPLQMFARDVRTLLFTHNGQLLMNQFERTYSQHYGVALSPASYGFPNVLALLQAVPHVVALKGKGSRRVLVLMQQFKDKLVQTLESTGDLYVSGTTSKSSKSGTPSSDSGYAGTKEALLANDDQELVTVLPGPTAIADLLSDPVPSCVPSPDLFPQPRRPPSSLIRFDMLPQKQGIDFLMLSEDEKLGLITPLCRTPVSDVLAFAAQLLPTTIHRKNMEDNSSRETTSALLSMTFQRELGKELPSADHESSDCCDFSESIESTIEDLGLNHKNEEIIEEIENGGDVADGSGDKSFGDHLDNLDLSELHVSDALVGDTVLDPSCIDDLACPLESVLSKEQTSAIGLPISPMETGNVNLSPGESEEVLPRDANFSTSIGEQFPVLLKSPISKVTRKPDSVRRSRIAARFDVSPIPSDFTSCHD